MPGVHRELRQEVMETDLGERPEVPFSNGEPFRILLPRRSTRTSA
jgi:hypothetical protein